MNAHDAIVAAVTARLRQAPAIAADILEEAEVDPVPESMDAAVVVAFVGSSPLRVVMRGNPVDWSTRVRIECYARADGRSLAAGRASRALHAQVYARLMADHTLGGAAIDISEPTLQADPDRSSTEVGCLVAEYDITHRTAARTLDV